MSVQRRAQIDYTPSLHSSQLNDTADISASRQKKNKNIWPSSAGPLNGGSTQKSLPDKTNNFAGELNDFVYVNLIVYTTHTG